MTQQTEAPPTPKFLVSCGTCDSAFVIHEGRQSCPCCGGEPTDILADLSVGPAPADDEPQPEGANAPSPSSEPSLPPEPAAAEPSPEEVGPPGGVPAETSAAHPEAFADTPFTRGGVDPEASGEPPTEP